MAKKKRRKQEITSTVVTAPFSSPAKKRTTQLKKGGTDVFKPPEFNPVDYMREEIRNNKVYLGSTAYAILFALISYGLTVTTGNVKAAFLIGILGVFGLKFIPYPLKIDVTKLTWKNWAGVGAIYILFWLGIWILISNPPFSDLSPPKIESIELEARTALGWNHTVKELGWLPNTIRLDDEITEFKIVVTAIDNQEITEGKIILYRIKNNKTRVKVIEQSMEKVGEKVGELTFESKFDRAVFESGTQYIAEIIVYDPAGHKTVECYNIHVKQS